MYIYKSLYKHFHVYQHNQRVQINSYVCYLQVGNNDRSSQ